MSMNTEIQKQIDNTLNQIPSPESITLIKGGIIYE